MNIFYILRGLPGSGKSTLAKQLAAEANDAIICSTDDYFYKDGIYQFDGTALPKAHLWNYNRTLEAFASNKSIVILDNTNIYKMHYANYINSALQHKYATCELIVGKFDDEFIDMCWRRNTHGVPRHVLQNMAKNFEF